LSQHDVAVISILWVFLIIETFSISSAHVKTSLMGASLTVPITNGKLNLGSWQGIWLCEHRDHANPRRIVVTLQGTQK
jgi:secondary thiamine-phosphate synthase enzyme